MIGARPGPGVQNMGHTMLWEISHHFAGRGSILHLLSLALVYRDRDRVWRFGGKFQNDRKWTRAASLLCRDGQFTESADLAVPFGGRGGGDKMDRQRFSWFDGKCKWNHFCGTGVIRARARYRFLLMTWIFAIFAMWESGHRLKLYYSI